MMKYKIVSRRKHFYNCPLCALVYVSAKALKTHYSSVHPSLSCDAVELDTDTVDDDAFDDLNMNSNYLFKEDLYTYTKPVLSISSESSTQLATNINNSFNNNNNNIQLKMDQVKVDQIDYSSSVFSSTKLITLTAPLQPIISHQVPTQVTIAPVYNIQMQQPVNSFHTNGQIARKSTVIPEASPVVATTMTISTTEKPEKKYNCKSCNKFFSTIYNKRRHDDMFHNNNAQVAAEFKCSSCDKVFTSIYNKNRHENVHKPIVERLKYKCVINNCNRGFTTQFILKMHIKKVHNVEVNW